MWGQALAIGLVIGSGVAVFVMALGTLTFLRNTQDTYYDRFRFAHVFASLKRAPDALEERIRRLPGVASVETRVVQSVTLDIPGLDEPAVGRMVSIPDRRRASLNELYLRSGRYIEPERANEVLVSEAFATANELGLGDRIHAILNGRLQELTIVGIALSPEYVFPIRPGDIVPDDRRFGIIWMGDTVMEAAFDMTGAFNDVVIRLMHGAKEQEVIARLDQLLEPYGGVGGYGRDEQISARFLSDEIKQLRAMGLVAPSIFQGVAAFLLNVVLTRLVSTQREQIAALKAFGYSNREIGIHYLKFAVLIVGFGCVVGVLTGQRLALALAENYKNFFRFPVFQYQFDLQVSILATAISMAAATIGAVQAVWRAVALPAAEAMRPEPPPKFRPTIIERLRVQQLFSVGARMIMRELERRPLKSLLSSLGIAFSVSVLILGNFGTDALDALVEFQFYTSQRQDVRVTMFEAVSPEAGYSLSRLPGVMQCELYRSVPIKIRAGHRERRTSILGLGTRRDLYRLLDAEEHPTRLPAEGLVLTDKLAELLEVQVGDTVEIDVLDGERPHLRVPVYGLIKELAGINAYMSKEALHRLLEETETVSGAFLQVDSRHVDELYRTLKETPRVAAVTMQKVAIQSFMDTIVENQLAMQSFNMVFACIIAFGVVYNTARISLSERSREMATLRVIGFTRVEISAILLGELAILTLLAIPMGIVIGYGFCAMMVYGFESENFRIPLVITLRSMGWAATITLTASLISGLIVRRKLDQLDLVAVLKSRD